MSDDLDRRRWHLQQMLHSTEMSGLQVSDATLADADDYAQGRIDVDELVARTRARYGLAPA